MVTASLLFTLLECSRYMMLGMISIINSQSVTESVFAEYNVPAYENYHLFLMDSGYGTGELLLSKVYARMQELGQENLNPSIFGFGKFTNFLQMDVTDSGILRYELAADHDAGALLGQMAQVMKKELPVGIAEQAYQKITGIQESCEEGRQADGYLDGALDTLEQAKEDAESGQNPGGSIRQQSVQIPYGRILRLSSGLEAASETGVGIEPADNPMEDIQDAKKSPLLSQILSDNDRVSAKKTVREDSIEYRTLNAGNYGDSSTSGIVNKVLITQYLKKYTSNYRKQNALPHALAYEQEYILFGKDSDEDNLKKMAGRMLLLREGINFAYLLSDNAKREEAFALAEAIALFTGVPAVVTAIQMGILASWAYAESIAELRTLFSGGKIAAIKTADSWTVSLGEIAAVPFRSSIKSKDVSNGQDYEDYLQAFLMVLSTNKIGQRFANLLEKNIRLSKGYEQIKLDCMITAMETNNIYHAQQVFLTFVTIKHLSKKGYRFQQTYDFSYLENSQ